MGNAHQTTSQEAWPDAEPEATKVLQVRAAVERRQAGGRASPVAAAESSGGLPGLPAFYFLSSWLVLKQQKAEGSERKAPAFIRGGDIDSVDLTLRCAIAPGAREKFIRPRAAGEGDHAKRGGRGVGLDVSPSSPKERRGPRPAHHPPRSALRMVPPPHYRGAGWIIARPQHAPAKRRCC